MRTRSDRSLLAVVIFLIQVVTAQGTEIHVSPDGSDSNSGTSAKPLQTLAAAQKLARADKVHGSVTVILHGGTYYLPRPLVFTSEDSGSASAPVAYVAAKDESPVISGGEPLQLKWEPYRDGIFQAATPAGVILDQLFVNGISQPMARYPNYDPNAEHFNGAAADALSPARIAKWKDPTGGYIHALHSAAWGSLHYRILGKDANGLKFEGGWQTNRASPMHDSIRFVENVFEELDAPGEWFQDAKTSMLYYMPPAGVDLAKARIETVRLTHLVEFRGDEKQPVQFVNLSGLTFTQAARTFMQTRETLLRTDWAVYRGGALFFDGATDCAVQSCSFNHLGGNAVFVSDFNRHLSIQDSRFDDIGASAILFVGDPKAVRPASDRTPGPLGDNYPADCMVNDCLIHNIGRVEKQVAGVDIDMAMSITVRHCSIYDTPRAGINIGDGCWGGHIVEFCDVFDTVLETGDHGSFNSWGRDRYWNLKGVDPNQITKSDLKDLPRLDAVKTNILRNNRWRCDHGWDIDLDDGSSNYEIRDNLCLNGGLKNREGFYRTVENNIIVNNSFHPHVWFVGSEDIFRNNIVFGPYRPIGVPTPWGAEIDFNVMHKPGQKTAAPAAELQAQSGRDAHSLSADAMFVDPERGDYRVKPDSPAIALGFRNFAMSGFGVESETLRKLARTPHLPGAGPEPTALPSARSGAVATWLGAHVKNVVGLGEQSAAGLPGEIGARVVDVSANSRAQAIGLRANDVILRLGEDKVDSLSDLFRLSHQAEGRGKVTMGLWRDQKLAPVDVEFVVTDDIGMLSQKTLQQPTADLQIVDEVSESSAFSAALKLSSLSLSNGLRVHTSATCPNDPASVLTDGKCGEGYGAVFSNGVADGKYKIDLGAARKIGQVNTYSYNEGGNRGHQRYALYGSTSDTDPGWSVNDAAKFTLIARVDSTSGPAGKYEASGIRRSAAALGTYRWLVWSVSPVTAAQENTAYQELQIIPSPDAPH